MSRSMKVLLPSVSVFSAGFGIWLRGKLDDQTFRWPVLPVVQSSAIVPSAPSKPAPTRGTSSGPSQIMKHGFPSMENIRAFDDFVLSYDRRNRTANWVFEHLTREKVIPGEGVTRDDVQFFEDEKVNVFFRATNEDYKKSGFDRGHLASAGNHRWSQTAMDQTFILSNISPQVGVGFNRGAWCMLEKYVRWLTKDHPNVYVCTGPLYLPRRDEKDGKLYVKYEVIGKNHVAVPTHFFKVIACESNSGDVEMYSFVMPNEPLKDLEMSELKQYLAPMESIERASGLLLFPNLPKNRIVKLNGK